MLLNRTVTRKILETLVHETFSQFGIINCSSLLDSLKLLGFYYATVAGISINLEDLKTPNLKSDCIEKANEEIEEVSIKWQQGLVSETERFQRIIDSWNIATESLKNKIVDYYKNLDPTNNLYIMAFSGARGNMSQVRQLVGMRGLMSDQEGNIIDLPIQRNFREGLSSIDYIISSYGARKGIVDTALKTADSGYLTRRLIYLAQDLIIREIDCETKEGMLVEFRKNSTDKNLIGRTLIKAISPKTMEDLSAKDRILTSDFLNELKEKSPLLLNIRSSLLCKSNGSICQKCYGWDLAHQTHISLGEAVGIIAAQSIGEPGTQLTMRTFHTGGIFTGENIKQILSPFSGKLILPKNLKTITYRTNHGILVLKLQEETYLTVINWEGKKTEIFLDIGSFLYQNQSTFIKKDQLIAEYSTQTLITGTRKLKPIYTSLAGEIRFENLLIRKMLKDKRTIKVNQDDGILWIASGKIFPLPKESEYLFPQKLSLNKPFARLKLISPISGVISLNNSNLWIQSKKNESFNLEITNITKNFKNCVLKISFLVKNYQYIDRHTILGYIEIFPQFEGLIYSVRKKNQKIFKLFF
jgi:DNA-directed RNA polymerase subunit beta'